MEYSKGIKILIINKKDKKLGRYIYRKSSELISDFLIFFLTSSIIFNVFYKELPSTENSRTINFAFFLYSVSFINKYLDNMKLGAK